MPTTPLDRFLTTFRATFRPPTPARNQAGNDWLVSGVWSDYMRSWLKQNFAHQVFEHPPRLDAALWFDKHEGRMDIALEWEWDNSKTHDEFPVGDFVKVLTVDAACGLAIIQTRADGRADGGRGVKTADETLDFIRQSYAQKKIDERPVGVIEIRRTYRDDSRVDFVWAFHDLPKGTTTEEGKWSFPTTSNPTEVSPGRRGSSGGRPAIQLAGMIWLESPPDKHSHASGKPAPGDQTMKSLVWPALLLCATSVGCNAHQRIHSDPACQF